MNKNKYRVNFCLLLLWWDFLWQQCSVESLNPNNVSQNCELFLSDEMHSIYSLSSFVNFQVVSDVFLCIILFTAEGSSMGLHFLFLRFIYVTCISSHPCKTVTVQSGSVDHNSDWLRHCSWLCNRTVRTKCTVFWDTDKSWWPLLNHCIWAFSLGMYEVIKKLKVMSFVSHIYGRW